MQLFTLWIGASDDNYSSAEEKMLQIECSNCRKQVTMPIIFDVKKICCPDCSAKIPPQNVFISAGPYNIPREALLKNLHRYRQLLSDAEREMAELRTSDSRNAESSARNANKLIYNLKELFAGCPDHQRHRFTGDAMVRFKINHRDFHGKLLNISLSGACIGDSNASFVIVSNIIDIALPDPEKEELNVQGSVVWTTRKGFLGIRFTDAHENTSQIKDYITRNCLPVKKRTV
jgi:PilZ domain-containing protein